MLCNNPVAIGPYANGYCDKELKMVDGKMKHEGACEITPVAPPAVKQIPCDCINCRARRLEVERQNSRTIRPREPMALHAEDDLPGGGR
jgi:hypothetical protein